MSIKLSHHLVQVMGCACSTSTHYLNQRWLISNLTQERTPKEIWIQIHLFLSKESCFKILAWKCRSFYSDSSMLNCIYRNHALYCNISYLTLLLHVILLDFLTWLPYTTYDVFDMRTVACFCRFRFECGIFSCFSIIDLKTNFGLINSYSLFCMNCYI